MDLNTADYKPITDVFHSLRPDIVIVNQNKIVTLELTVCHETNKINSKQFKTNKYAFLFDHLTDKYANCIVSPHTIVVTTLGIVFDINTFCKDHVTGRISDLIKRDILILAVSDSFKIYCNQNNTEAPKC